MRPWRSSLRSVPADSLRRLSHAELHFQKRVAQFFHSHADSGLDGTERHAESRGNLDVRQLRKGRELDSAPLLVRKRTQRPANQRPLLAEDAGFIRQRRAAGQLPFTLYARLLALAAAGVGAQAIERPAPRQQRQPSPYGSARRIETPRFAPYLLEDVEQHLVGILRVTENAQRQAVERDRKSVV